MLLNQALCCSISTVYRATCSITKWPLIIKAYQKSKMKEKNFLRMEREIRLMRLLEEDDSVVQLYNVFEDASFKYLVMEMCKGGDLFKAMLLRGGKMDEQWACAEVQRSPPKRAGLCVRRAAFIHVTGRAAVSLRLAECIESLKAVCKEAKIEAIHFQGVLTRCTPCRVRSVYPPLTAVSCLRPL